MIVEDRSGARAGAFDLRDLIVDFVRELSDAFRSGVKLTFVARDPADPDSTVVISTEDRADAAGFAASVHRALLEGGDDES